jgi:hypothetical protein
LTMATMKRRPNAGLDGSHLKVASQVRGSTVYLCTVYLCTLSLKRDMETPRRESLLACGQRFTFRF